LASNLPNRADFSCHFTKTGQSAAIRALQETEAIEIIKTVFA